MSGPSMLAILAVLIFLLGSIAIGAAGGPVSRTRVEPFARRQRLTITAANGDHVIRYLATARRWRAAGATAGILASVTAALPQGQLRVDFFLLFAGWFLGALVAEFRVAHLEHRRR